MKFFPLREADTYFLKRHRVLTEEMMKRAGLRFAKSNDLGYIAIPHASANGETVAWKMRVAPGFAHKPSEKWRFYPEKVHPVYGLELWPEKEPKRVVLCEGEFDCITLAQEGFAALTSTTGVASSLNCLQHLPASLEEGVLLAFDNDDAGCKAAVKVAAELKMSRPDVKVQCVAWPEGFDKDVTDFAVISHRNKEKFAAALLGLAVDIDDDFMKKYGPPSGPTSPRTQTPRGFIDTTNLPTATIADVLERTRKIGCVHDHIVEVVLATYISKEIEKRNPVWLMLVGNPSSNKTQLVSLLRWATETLMIDVMTANPFISGMSEKDRPHDLLPSLDGKCFIVKDYTSFFGRSEETVKQLLSDLVSIYDGEFSKHSGARGTIRHHSTFSHIGCVTPEGLKMRQRYMDMVGARFLIIRVPELTEEQRERCFNIAWADDLPLRCTDAAKAAISLVKSICESIRANGLKLQSVEPSLRQELNLLALLTARARGGASASSISFKSENGDQVSYTDISDPQAEEPFRALHQFKALARSLAVLRGKEAVSVHEVRTVRLVALSTMPVHRGEVLSVFKTHERLSAKEVGDLLTKHPKRTKRSLDELWRLGVLHREKGEVDELEAEGEDGKKKPWLYSPHPRFQKLLRGDGSVLDGYSVDV